MKIIQELQERVHEELEDSKWYIERALHYKDEEKDLADVYYWLSSEEMSHADKLHKTVVNIIETYRKKEGDPPPEMMAVYNYLHDKEIALAKEVKMLWTLYK